MDGHFTLFSLKIKLNFSYSMHMAYHGPSIAKQRKVLIIVIFYPGATQVKWS